MADETNQLRVRLRHSRAHALRTCGDAVELPAKNGYFEVLYDMRRWWPSWAQAT